MKISIMALCVCLSVAFQSESFEKRAISAAQRIPASTLDAKLPNRSFGVWLNGLVGKDAGIVWQLAECGAGAPGRTGQDTPVCAEASALLPNGDTVVIGISVGTYKQGLIGDPAFQGAVIKSGDQLYQVRRLSDLPMILRTPSGVPRALPDLQAGPLRVDTISPTMYPLLASLNPDNDNPAPRFRSLEEQEPTPAPPPPQRSQQNSGQLMDASIIRSPKPVYPPAARANGVVGKVEVQVVISEAGRVINATAISGPMMLRAGDAAGEIQSVVNTATRNGTPVKTEKVLTYNFGDK